MELREPTPTNFFSMGRLLNRVWVKIHFPRLIPSQIPVVLQVCGFDVAAAGALVSLYVLFWHCVLPQQTPHCWCLLACAHNATCITQPLMLRCFIFALCCNLYLEIFVFFALLASARYFAPQVVWFSVLFFHINWIMNWDQYTSGYSSSFLQNVKDIKPEYFLTPYEVCQSESTPREWWQRQS